MRLGVVVLALLLTACQSMSDVKPGDGKNAHITGKSYDQVWAAAVKVADAHFEIREQDMARGIITGERTMTAFLEYGERWKDDSMIGLSPSPR